MKINSAEYNRLHYWARANVPKVNFCQHCKVKPAVDVANKSGKYLKDITDWERLCRKCHMDSDNRNNQLRESGKSRKLPNKNCEICGTIFHRTSYMKIAKYCSRKCYYKSKLNKISNPKGINQYA